MQARPPLTTPHPSPHAASLASARRPPPPQLNRFDSFGWLLAAYLKTGNPIYTRYFDALVIDWATHNPCPDALSGGGACSPQGVATSPPCAWGAGDAPGAQACATGTFESPWRSLEMGIRTNGVFAAAFFGFQRAAEFSTSARALVVLAMGEHNAALSVDGGHPGRGTPNWVSRPRSRPPRGAALL